MTRQRGGTEKFKPSAVVQGAAAGSPDEWAARRQVGKTMCDIGWHNLVGSPYWKTPREPCVGGGVHESLHKNPNSTIEVVPVDGYKKITCTACGMTGECTD